MHAFLTGFMGAGKTTLGALLSEKLSRPFIDLDREIEHRAGKSVVRLFAEQGERRFRQLEDAELRRLVRKKRLVVATGGGLPISRANRLWMREFGVILWLDTPFDVIVSRVGPGAGRPLFEDPEQAQALYQERLEAYRDCDVRIDTSVGGRADLAETLTTEFQDFRRRATR